MKHSRRRRGPFITGFGSGLFTWLLPKDNRATLICRVPPHCRSGLHGMYWRRKALHKTHCSCLGFFTLHGRFLFRRQANLDAWCFARRETEEFALTGSIKRESSVSHLEKLDGTSSESVTHHCATSSSTPNSYVRMWSPF